jgi:membrane protease YdiL (CAAX protease family)
MATIVSLIKRHSVLTFFVLTFAISWGGILFVIGPNVTPAKEGEIEILMPIIYLVFITGPCIAGILMTILVNGRASLRDFHSRLLKWRVNVRWYAVALLMTPFLLMAVLGALSLISSDFLPRIFTTDDKTSLLQFSIIVGLTVSVLEELGWTGFAVPTLRLRYGVLTTGLIVGLVWGVRQFLVVYWVVGSSVGSLSPLIYFPAILLTWMPTYRVLMVWVYDRTGSLLVAILMHASLVTFWTMLTPLTITGVPLMIYYLAFTTTMWGVIGVATVANGGRWSANIKRSSA